MGTVMNGNKWGGVCVNGNVVSGLVKNGVVFYKKAPSVYKRRIMVGDNLRDTIVYQDFPNSYYNEMPNEDTFNNLVIMGSSTFGRIFEQVISASGTKAVGTDGEFTGGTPSPLSTVGKYYLYSDGNEVIQNFHMLDQQDLVVSEVVSDNSSYRHLYIKDPNIRPIQVGDVLTDNTKIYFTFPDNFKRSYSTSTSRRIQSSNGLFELIIGFLGEDNRLVISAYSNLDMQETVTIYNMDKGINKSVLDLNDFEYPVTIAGTVENFMFPEEDITEHILVDITTLG